MRSIERTEAQTGRTAVPPTGGSIGARVLAMAQAATAIHMAEVARRRLDERPALSARLHITDQEAAR